MIGRIVKAISGFYYVDVDGIVFECKARGNFRNSNISPLCGDMSDITAENGKGVVNAVCDRRNQLTRPPVANVDKLFIVSSSENPSPNLLLIDRLTVIAEKKGIEPIIVFNKSDLSDMQPYVDIYKTAGFTSFAVSCKNGENLELLKECINGSLCVFTGNSGVGKSSILNELFPQLSLKTGEVSEKLGRGRHTTRHVELFKCFDGYVADTPGFSSLDIERYEPILCHDLAENFKEFNKHSHLCKFTSCSHTCEKGCAVLDAVNRGEIPRSRHESYCTLYNEVKDIKEWNLKK